MKRHPLEILRKKLPGVLNGHSLILVSVIEPNPRARGSKKLYRVMYYIYGFTSRIDNRNYIVYKYVPFEIVNNTQQNPNLQEEAKYKIIGDASEILVRRATIPNEWSETISRTLQVFNTKNIDTICITDPNGSNVKILYDATGHLEVANRFKNKAEYWIGRRHLAQQIYHPQRLKQAGYFDNPELVDLLDSDRDRLAKLRLEDQHVYPSIFNFGKLKSLKRDLLKIKKII